MKGYDIPIYVNIGYPFKINPPFIHHEWNPVGSYKRDFSVPSDWKDKGGIPSFRSSKFCILCMGK